MTNPPPLYVEVPDNWRSGDTESITVTNAAPGAEVSLLLQYKDADGQWVEVEPIPLMNADETGTAIFDITPVTQQGDGQYIWPEMTIQASAAQGPGQQSQVSELVEVTFE